VLLVRVDGDLFFGNAEAVGERLEEALAASPAARHLVLVLSAVNAIDTSALFALRDWNQMLRQRGIGLHLAEVKGPVIDRLRNSDLLDQLNGRVFLSTAMAWNELAGDAQDQHC
jgi:SulP family sulfate permease